MTGLLKGSSTTRAIMVGMSPGCAVMTARLARAQRSAKAEADRIA